MGSFKTQELANTAWAFAQASELDTQLFMVLAKVAEWRVGSFNTQGLANTAWAFAQARQLDTQLFWCSGKRFSVSFGDGVEKSQRGRGYVAHRWFYRTLLGGLGRSWRTFCLIFSLSFFTLIFIDFISISEGVWEGFGRAKW